MQSTIDGLLHRATESGDIPGIVALAVTAEDTLYEGSSGVRDISTGASMTDDTIVWYASMTKALVGAAAMHLVENGRVTLDEPLGPLLPFLADPQVLEGYDESGAPRLRPAKGDITLHHLMTHTAGFGYEIWNADINRYSAENKLPSLLDSKRRTLRQPLVADPGTRWEYGISTDWVGMVIEEVSGKSLEDYLIENILDPLGMDDTRFIMRQDQIDRLATVHQRAPDGSLATKIHAVSQEPEFHMGGGGLYGTARDYATFIQMMLNDGRSSGGEAVLSPDTVALMASNAIGDMEAGVLRTVDPPNSFDANFFPGMSQRWGLTFLINPEEGPNGRSAGSLCWAGLANCYFWIDRRKRVGGVLLTQVLPFADPTVLGVFDAFERAIYSR